MTKRRRAKPTTLGCVLALLLTSEPGLANGNESANAVAVARGNEAVALYEAGRFADALTRFREADTLYHSPVFVLYEARCLRGEGDVTEARAAYRRLLDEAVAPDAPPVWKQAQADARAELAALEAELDRERAAAVATPLVPAASSTAPPPPEATPPAPIDGGGHTPVEGEQRQKSGSVSLPGIVLASSGGAALIAASVIGIVALNKEADLRRNPPAGCESHPPGDTLVCLHSSETAMQSRQQPIERLALTSDVLFVAGGISAAAGVALLLFTRSDASEVGVVVSPSGAEVRGHF